MTPDYASDFVANVMSQEAAPPSHGAIGKKKSRTPPPAPQPLAYGRAQLASALGVSATTLDRYHALGLLPAPIKLLGRKLWSIAEIQAWLAAGGPDRVTWDAIKATKPPRKEVSS